LLLTLCGLTSQKTHQGGPGLGGLVHEEAHSCFPYFAQRTFKSIDAGGFHRPLVQLIPPINYSIRKEIFTYMSLTLSLTLCDLTSQKTHQGGLGLGGLVHEEAHPCFTYYFQTPFKRIDAGSTNCQLVQLS